MALTKKEALAATQRKYYLKNKEAYFQRAKVYARKRKVLALELHGSMSCEICGESRPHCLSFHHRDPATKGQYNSKGKDIVRLAHDDMVRELALCDVLCHNCHADLHYTGDD